MFLPTCTRHTRAPQDFVGSNNINLLYPSGMFGTRRQGGKDAASPRYIYTKLAALSRHLFNEADDQLLNYLNEDGQKIEPEWWEGGWVVVWGPRVAEEGGHFNSLSFPFQ